MSSYRKYTVILFIFFSMLWSLPVLTYAKSIQIPDNIRIGLYYGGTAATSFSVSAEKGLQIGYIQNNSFSSLYEETDNTQITVAKDADLHIQIGGNYSDINTVNSQIKVLKQKGLQVYPVYSGSLQIWTGSYCDSGTAQKDLTSSITPKLGSTACKIVQSSAARIKALDGAGSILAIVDNGSSVFQIRPRAENSPYAFKINSTNSYRGYIEVRRFTGSDMTVINILPLEQYLYGVVPCELEASAPLEALKAQAVAARTYSLNNLGKYSKWSFDMSNSTSDQVYKGLSNKGLSNENSNSNKAVDDTKGKVVAYQGSLAEVFYFASDGGKTEDSENVFGGVYPYLKSVDDEYESGNSWHYTWEVTLTASKIKDILVSKGYDIGDILDVKITKTSEAGRVTELLVKGTKGEKTFTKSGCRNIFSLDSQWYTISGSGSDSSNVNIRLGDSTIVKDVLGGKKIMTSAGLKTLSGDIAVVDSNGNKRSISSAISRSGSDTGIFKISGRGWGHGVGMSQEGAKGMAKAGFTYDQILEHYFQGTTIQ